MMGSGRRIVFIVVFEFIIVRVIEVVVVAVCRILQDAIAVRPGGSGLPRLCGNERSGKSRKEFLFLLVKHIVVFLPGCVVAALLVGRCSPCFDSNDHAVCVDVAAALLLDLVHFVPLENHGVYSKSKDRPKNTTPRGPTQRTEYLNTM